MDATALGLVVGVAGLAMTIGFGLGSIWQGQRATAETQRHVSTEVAALREAVVGPVGHIATQGDARLKLAAVVYADVLNAGETFLVVQSYTGAHATALDVYGWRAGAFQQLARLLTGTPEGFTIGDLDGDGRTEVASVDWDIGRIGLNGQPLSYAAGARVERLYRWNGTDFEVIAQRELPLPGEPGDSRRLWHKRPIKIPDIT